MKMIITVLASFAFAAAAQATPAVGDRVAFQGTWGTETIQQGLAFTEYNAQRAQFKKVTVTQVGSNAPQTSEEWVNASDTASDAALEQIVKNCAAYQGVSENVAVPAGTFLTCKMALDQGGFVWIGQVPFAVVRIETPVDGRTLTAVLSGVARGQ